MTPTENARRARTGAGILKAGERFEYQHTNTDPEIQYQPSADECVWRLAGPRFERRMERLHCLGPRVIAEMLADIATATGSPGLIADHVEKYADLDPEIVRALGADRFPAMPLTVIR